MAWEQYGDIVRYNAEEWKREHDERPVVCPNHANRLEESIGGNVLHCPFGGELFDLRGNLMLGYAGS